MNHWIIKLLGYEPEDGFSGPNAPTKYPPGTIVIADRRPSSLCLTVRFAQADREARLLTCQVGMNPAITAENELARRKLAERWEELRSGLEAALQQVADLRHPLPVTFDDLIYLMASDPPTPDGRAVVTADFDFGRRRRQLLDLRDEHDLYLLKPTRERLACWWQRCGNEQLRANFAAQVSAHELGKRLDQLTMAEQYLRRGNDRPLRNALIANLSGVMQSLYSALYAHDERVVAELEGRGRAAGAMTAVALNTGDWSEAEGPPAPPELGTTITPANLDQVAPPEPTEPGTRCETLVACDEDVEPPATPLPMPPAPLPISVPRAGTEFVVGAPEAPAHLRAMVARVPASPPPKITQVKGGDPDKD